MAEDYTVREGDCLSSIAYEHGFFWETLWNHADNSELTDKRKDPNVIKAGDTVRLPDRTLGIESGATEARHRFRLKGVPAKLRLRILAEPPPTDAPAEAEESEAPADQDAQHVSDEDPVPPEPEADQPAANVPYHLDIDGQLFSGRTDSDGRIERSIPPNARLARLTLEPNTERQRLMVLRLGHLDPIDDLSGIKQRLANLGFECGDRTDEATPALASAIRAFQKTQGLAESGEADAPLRDKLRECHGG